MIKRSLMVFVLGLALNAPWALAQSHVDTQVRDAENGLILVWKEVFAWMNGDPSPRAERALEIARQQMKAFFAWQGESYFPQNALGPNDGYGDSSYARYFSYYLRGLKEPILYNGHMAKDEVSIRLTILPAFGGPLVFRAHSNGPDNTLTFKLSDSGGFGPVKDVQVREITLDHRAFMRILDRAFETPACEGAHDERMGFDGSSWAVEVKTADRYCADSVWAPDAGPWQDLAQVVFQYIEVDDEVLFAKWMIGMPLSENEERRINEQLR